MMRRINEFLENNNGSNTSGMTRKKLFIFLFVMILALSSIVASIFIIAKDAKMQDSSAYPSYGVHYYYDDGEGTKKEYGWSVNNRNVTIEHMENNATKNAEFQYWIVRKVDSGISFSNGNIIKKDYRVDSGNTITIYSGSPTARGTHWLDIYAVWNITYSVTHKYKIGNSVDSTASTSATATYEEGAGGSWSYTFPFKDKTGFSRPTSQRTTSTNNKSITYNYSLTGAKVKFDANGGSNNGKTLYCEEGGRIRTPTSKRTNYEFLGWYLDGYYECGGGEDYYPSYGEYTELEAEWEYVPPAPTIYKKYLNANGGTQSYSTLYYQDYTMYTGVSGNYGTNIVYSLPALPTKTGYEFVGYFNTLATTGGTLYIDENGIFQNILKANNNVTIYARWKTASYERNFNLNNGENQQYNTLYYVYNNRTGLYSSVNATTGAGAGTRITYMSVPTKLGYTFGGYYSSASGSGTQYVNASGYFTTNMYSANSDLTMYAKWTANTYTIKFNANGGTGSTPANIVKVYSTTQSITFPTNGALNKQGFSFLGWSTNASGVNPERLADTSVRLSEIIQSSLTINYYAIWGEELSTLTIVTNEDVPRVLTVSKQTGATYVLPAVNKVGHKLQDGSNAWTIVGDGSWVKSGNDYVYTFGSEDATITANWQPNVYMITFDPQGGIISNNTMVILYGTMLQRLTVFPKRDGYKFQGYYTQTNGGGDRYYSGTGEGLLSYNIAGNITLYAFWIESKFELNVQYNGGEDVYKNAEKYYIDQLYNAVIDLGSLGVSRKGYNLTGWSIIEGAGIIDNQANTFQFDSEDARIRATWVEKTFPVTLDLNGGNFNGNIDNIVYTKTFGKRYDYLDGQTVALPTPKKIGFNFVGWKNLETGSLVVDAMIIDTDKAHTLTAEWTNHPYILIIDYSGGRVANQTNFSISSDYQDTLVLDVPQRKGYTWDGFAFDQETLNLNVEDKGTINNISKTFTFGECNAKLYTKWTPIKYTVEFDNNGAPAFNEQNLPMGMESISVKYDESVILKDVNDASVNLSRKGYTFMGWNTKSNGTGRSFSNKGIILNLAEENGVVVTLYAQWEIQSYLVVFNANGGVFDNGSTIDDSNFRRYGDIINATPSNVTRVGYQLKSDKPWVNLAGEGVTFPYTVTKNDTITAQWEAIEYTITYDTRGGSFVDSNEELESKGWTIISDTQISILVAYNSAYPMFPEIERTGYNLRRLLRDAQQVLSGTIMQIPNSHSIVAEWSIKSYIIQFSGNGGDLSYIMINMNYGTTFGGQNAFPTAHKPGYEFVKWTSRINDVLTDIDETYAIVGDMLIIANWKAKSYTLTFDAMGALFDNDPSYSVVNGKVNYTVEFDSVLPKFPVARQAGFNFNGWWTTNSVGTGVQIYEEVSTYQFTEISGGKYIGRDATLYARWSIVSYVIVYDANGGVIQGNWDSSPIAYGQPYGQFPQVAKTGYTLLGWTLERDAEELIDPAKDLVSESRTVYAKWVPNSYVIEFNSNGGIGVMEPMTVKYDQQFTWPVCGFNYEGREFAVWNLNVGGTDTSFYPGGKYVNLTSQDSIAIYAIWEIIPYVITVDAMGGDFVTTPGWIGSFTSSSSTMSFTYGDELVLPTVEREGYDFIIWVDSEGNEVNMNVLPKLKVTKSETYSATWQAKSYAISYNPDGGVFEETGTGAIADAIRRYDEAYGVLPVVTKAGYILSSWSVDVNGTSYIITETTDLVVASNHEVKAIWEKSPITLTFNANGGHLVAPYEGWLGNIVNDVATISAFTNSSYPDFPTASRNGYIFDSWRIGGVEGEEAVQDSIFVGTQATTLVAVWISNEYTLMINPNGGFYDGSDMETKVIGQPSTTLQLKDFTRTGYQLDGLELTSDVSIGFGTLVKNGTKWTYEFGYADAVITAKWIAQTYNVAFDLNGGVGAVSNISVTFGERYNKYAVFPNNPTLVGKVFIGWFDGRNDGYQIRPDDVVTKAQSHTLYARWSDSPCGLTIDPMGGKFTMAPYVDVSYRITITTETGEENGITLIQYNVVRDGYRFDGWTNATTSVGNFSGDKYVFTDGGQGLITAKWTPITYSIKFMGGEGVTGQMPNQANLVYDSVYNVNICNFEKPGYKFYGWRDINGTVYYDGQSIKNLSKTQNEVIEFVAQWQIQKYSLRIDFYNGEYDGSPNLRVLDIKQEFGTSYTMRNIVRSGYDCVGWVLSEVRVAVNPTDPTAYGNVEYNSALKAWVYTFGDGADIITPVWEAQQVEVTLDLNGGNLNSTNGWQYNSITQKYFQMFSYDGAYESLPDENMIEKTGFSFLGWKTSNGYRDIYVNNGINVVNATAHTLYAQWEVNVFKLIVDPQGGNLNGSDVQVEYSGNINDKIVINSVEKKGYNFAGWDIVSGSGQLEAKENSTVFTFASMDCSIKALWTPIEYTIVYNANGGEGNMANSHHVYNAEGETLNELAFERLGYIFKYWTLDAEGQSNKKFFDKDTISNLITISGQEIMLYAQWSINAINVEFDALGGEINKTSIVVNYGEMYDDLPNANKIGYTFDGWWTENGIDNANWGVNITNQTIVSATENHTLYAKYTIKILEVTFFAVGSAIITKADWVGGVTGGSSTTKLLTIGEQYGNLPEAIYPGLLFRGWFLNYDGGKVLITPETIVTIGENHRIEAEWSISSITVLFNANGGLVNLLSKSVIYSTAYGDLPVPVREGCLFKGWYKSETFDEEVTSTSIVLSQSEHTLYAKWEKIKILLTYNVMDGEFDKSATFAGVYEANGTATLTLNYGSIFGNLPVAKKVGYSFLGWFSEINGGYLKGNDSVASNIDGEFMYARFVENTYMLVVDPSGGFYRGASQVSSVEYTYNAEVEIELPTRSGFEFTGWTVSPELAEVNLTPVKNEKDEIVSYVLKMGDYFTQITANWRERPYIVTFNANGGKITSAGWVLSENDTITTMQVTFGSIYNWVPECSMAGYTFNGWWTSIDDGLPVNEQTQMTTPNDHTLYAQYKIIDYRFIVNPLGGVYIDNIDIKEYTGNVGTIVDVPNPTRDGYTFNGWTKIGTSGTFEEISAEMNMFTFGEGNVTISANWIANKYEVVFIYGDISEFSALEQTREVVFGEVYNILPEPIVDGYDFLGWWTKNGEGDDWGNQIVATYVVNISENHNLFAKWREKSYVLTLVLNGGELNEVENIITFEGKVGDQIQFSKPLKLGYTFVSWTGYEFQINAINDEEIIYIYNVVSQNITANANWSANRYNITIDAGDEATIDVSGWLNEISEDGRTTLVSVKQDSVYPKLPKAIKRGFVFAGWWTESGEFGTQIVEGALFNLASEQTIYAKWSVLNTFVSINLMGGEYTDINGQLKKENYNIEGAYGETIILLNPVRVGYKFDGWKESNIDKVNLQYIGDDLVYRFNESNEVITASWLANLYKVTFNLNGGTVVASSKWNGPTGTENIFADYRFGSPYELLPTPIKVGATFDRWEDAGGREIIATSIVDIATDHVLNAVYTTTQHTLTINPNGGVYEDEGESISSTSNLIVVTKGDSEKYTLKTPTKVGYVFDYWVHSGSGSFNDVTNQYTFIGTSTITAMWSQQEIAITFNGNGGEITGNTAKNVFFDGVFGELPTAVKSGYSFAGWWTKNGDDDDWGEQILNTSIVKFEGTTQSLYARFSSLSYTLNIVLDGGVLSDEVNVTRRFGETYEFDKPVKSGYEFVAWQGATFGVLTNGATKDCAFVFGAGNDTIIATWQARDVEIIFDLMGGNVEGDTGNVTVDKKYGQAYVTLPTPKKTLNSFAGWWTEENGGEQIVSSSLITQFSETQLTSSSTLMLTLYAHWTTSPCVLTIVPNGGLYLDSFNNINITDKLVSETITISVPTRDGYTFTGWQVTNNTCGDFDSQEQTEFVFSQAGTCIITAQWDANVYTVTINTNGVELNEAEKYTFVENNVYIMDATFGSTYQNLPLDAIMIISGMSFDGWWTKDGTNNIWGERIISNSKVNILDNNFKLFAKWSLIEYYLVINPNGGTYNHSTSTTVLNNVTDGQNITLSMPVRNGYTFNSWDKQGVGQLNVLESGNIQFVFGAGAGQLTAKWDAKSYEITLNAGSGNTVETSSNWNRIDESDLTKVKKSVLYGSQFGALPTAYKKGSKFVGWQLAVQNALIINTSIMNYSNVSGTELVAVYEPILYTLLINPNMGEYFDTMQLIAKTSNIVSLRQMYGSGYVVKDPSRVGYRFAGWTSIAEIDGEGIYDTASKTFTFGQGNYALTANWEPIKYNIVYRAGDGAEGEMAVAEFTYGVAQKLNPNQFTKTGYEFVNWTWNDKVFIDEDLVLNLVSTNKDLEFVAQWMPKIYTITLNPVGGECSVKSIPAKFNDNYSNLPSNEDVRKYGYIFIGWWTDVESGTKVENGQLVDIVDDVILYAHWQENKYTLTLPMVNPDYATISILNEADEWVIITENYINNEIKYNSSFKFKVTIKPAYNLSKIKVFANDVELKYSSGVYEIFNIKGNQAISISGFQVNTYNVTFDTLGGSTVETQIVEHGKKLNVMPVTPSRVNYVFAGWTNEYDDDINLNDLTITRDMIIKAKYSKATYTVSLYVDGILYNTETVEYLGKATRPENNPVKEGYNFVGWKYFIGDLSGFNFELSIDRDISLYAEFEMIKFDVEFYSEGKIVYRQPVNYGSKVSKPVVDPIKTGWTFNHWSLDLNGDIIYGFNNPITEATKLYAYFEINVYSITFWNGTEEYLDLKKEIKYFGSIGETIPQAEEGYDFKYWKNGKNGPRFSYNTQITESLKLYAVFERKILKVDFVVDDEIYKTYNVEYGYGLRLDDLPLIPSKTGYNVNEPYWDNLDGLTSVKENKIITAIYIINTYLVQFKMPNGEIIKMTVGYGESVLNPPKLNNLKFGEALRYSESYDNVTDEKIIVVTVYNYLKVPVIIGAIILLFIIILVIVKLIKRRAYASVDTGKVSNSSGKVRKTKAPKQKPEERTKWR